LTPVARAAEDGGVRAGIDQRGIGLIEIAIVLVILALAGTLLFRYMGSTARTVEQLQEQRPLAHARLAADRATLVSLRSALHLYQTQHGQWPADKAAVLALLPAAPRFQCAGNDVEYDPAGRSLRLLIDDPGRC
jgi:type II secretory pathway pseudopilin PulG